MIPLFGHPRYFEDRAAIERYRTNVLVALEVTPPVMREFAATLEAEGWNVCRIEEPAPNPANLMEEALTTVTTGYALRLDTGTCIGPGLAKMVAAVEASRADLSSVKVEAEGPSTTPRSCRRSSTDGDALPPLQAMDNLRSVFISRPTRCG